MPKPSKFNSRQTKVYLQPGLVRTAKSHSARNGFTLSGWVSLLLQRALGRKSAPRKKLPWSLGRSPGRREFPSTVPNWSWPLVCSGSPAFWPSSSGSSPCSS